MTAAERFFLQELPAAIIRDLQRFRLLSGTLAFSCAGEKYTVRLGDLDAPVILGFERAADVKVWFFGDAFERFIRGEKVSGKKHVMVQGDLDVLERFGRLLVTAQNAVSIRLRGN